MDPFDLLTSCSDEELLESFQRGEKESFGALVRRYSGELYGYSAPLSGGRNIGRRRGAKHFFADVHQDRPVRTRPARQALALYDSDAPGD